MPSRILHPYGKHEDLFWGLDHDLVRRMGGLFAIIGVALSLVMWPLSPLSDQIGNSGWTIGAINGVLTLAFGMLLILRPAIVPYWVLGAASFASVAMITSEQWLAGGAGEPYENLIVLPVIFTCAVFPLRIVVPFMLAVAAGLAAPLFYDEHSGDLVANALGDFLLFAAMGAAIHYLILRIRLQRVEMERGEKTARAEARNDELTGIGNRRAFEEALADEISRSDRMKTPLALAMGDIEHFKRINDEFGHLEGDRALSKVAAAMDSELRSPDRVFRWGGDEFILLLPGTTKEDADILIERVQNKVSVACRRPDNEPIFIHFAAAELEDRMTAKELCAAADLALMAERAKDHRARV